MRLKCFTKYSILKWKRKKRLQEIARTFSPQFFLFSGILSIFYPLRHTALCWQFDNCTFRDSAQIKAVLFSADAMKDWGGVLCVWIALYALVNFIFPRKICNIILSVFIIFEILLGLTNFYMIVNYSCSMEDMFSIIRAADGQEVREYFLSMFSQFNLLLTVLFLLFAVLGAGVFFGMNRLLSGRNKFCSGGLFLFFTAISLWIYGTDYKNIKDPALQFFLGINTPDPFLQKITWIVSNPKLPDGLRNSLIKENPVFGMIVIGESDNRHHHSLYGYEKDTDYFLRKTQKDMIRFTDAVSATASTIHSIFFMFTDAVIQKKYEYPDYGFCEFFRTAGAEISLHDVQRSHGAWSSALALLFANADQKVKYSDDGKNHYDEEILENVRKESALAEKKSKLMVIHLMGSHYDQRFRVPETWLKQHHAIVAGMDPYDKSITCTGYILSELYTAVIKKDQPSFLLYIPDHSETPVSKRSMTTPEKIYYEIPMFLWFNKAFRKHYPETVTLAEKAAGRKFQTDLALQLIAHLMQIPQELTDRKKDLLSPDYKPECRLIGWGEIPYDPSPRHAPGKQQ